MARKSLLEEIRERESKPADTSGGITQYSQSSGSNNGRRKSLLEEIRDTTGGEGLNKKYVDRALKNGGGFGAASGGIEYGDEGETYLTHDYASESRLLSEIRRSGTKPYTAQGGVYKQEDMSPFQMAIDRILGVDRTQVTGGKTDWGKLLKGTFEQGANKANSRFWEGLNFLAGGFSQELRTLGETTYNDIVDALNMIPGVDLDYIGGTTNAITALKNQAVAANAAVEKKYTANANTSRAAQIVNILGSETVAAIPAALEAIFLAPAAAAGTGATTLGLDYASSLAKSGGLSGVSTMAAEGFRKLTSNPQFWTSYLDVVGDSYEGALEDGMSQDDATVFALVNSFINAVIEIGGVDEALGGIQNLPYKQAKAAQNNGKKAVVEWFKDAVLGEGKEEVFQGAFERGLGKVSGNNVPWFSSDMKDTDAVINPWTAAQEFTGGAVVGALLGGGQVGIDRAVNGAVDIYNDKSEQRAYKKAYGSGAQELINESQELNPGNGLAKKAQSRLDSGKSISGRDIRDIVRQNEAAIRTLEENRQEQDQPQTGAESAAKSSAQDGETSRETEQAFIRQVIEETGASDEAARVLEDGYIPEVNDAQSYAYGVREAFKLGEMGLDYQQAVETAQFFDSLEEQQFKHAFDLGAMKGGQVKEEAAAQREERKYYDSIKEFSAEFSSPDKVTEIFNEKPDVDISEFADGFRTAYDMGKSGVSKRTFITALTEKQRTAAYNMGAADSDAEAAALSAKNKAPAKSAGKKWNAGTVKYDGEYKGKGTVKGIGVNMKDVVQTLGINDVQKSAYRVCAKIAEATGINIVFYKSEAEADGRFRATQGEFSRSDPGTIYIDLNAGLGTIKDVSDLGKYTLLHTFSHEFTHFIEKWNPAQYNELRRTVFAEMEKNGKDVDALIRSKKGEGMSYDAASREAVAESLTEILPQAEFAETLYNEHRSLYEQIADKLKEFVEDIKAYFSTVRHDARNAYSSALMRELDGALKYSENVLSIFDEAARGAVENYQLTLDSGNTAESKSKAAKRVGMDFFRTEEYVAANESAPVLRDMIQSKSTADNDSGGALTSDNGFTVSRNPEYNSVEVSFAEKPSEAVRDVLKANKFRWNGKKRVWYGKTEENTIAEALNKVYEAEKAADETADAGNAETSAEESDATAAEIIKAAEAEKAAEDVPPTAETEAAKQEIKKEIRKSIRFPVETANDAALETALKNKELSIDNVTLPGTVDGFNKEQRAYIVENLIEGYYAGKDVISLKVPFDGKLSVNNSMSNVLYVLKALKAKVNQEIDFNKKLLKILKEKAMPVYAIKYNDNCYVTNGAILVPVSEEAYKYGIEELQMKPTGEDAAKSAVDRNYDPAAAPDEVIGRYRNKEMVLYRFEIPNGYAYFDAEYIKYLDSDSFSLSKYVQYGNSTSYILKSLDADGNVVGYVVSIRAPETDGTVKPSKLKAFRNNKQIPEKPAEADKIQEVNSDGANENNGKAVLEPEPAGDGASRLLDEVQAGDVQGAGGERETVADAQERTGQDKRDSEGQPVSTRDSGSNGAGQSGDIRRNDELTHVRDEALKETVKVQIEQKSSDTPKGSNFVIGESLSLPAGEKARFKANVDAIKLIKQLEDEGRFATAAEQEVLSKYVGWGGLSNAFGELKWNSAARKSEMIAKSGWEKEFGELKGLIEDGYITEEEYKGMSASTKNAHYTSVEVIKAMYDGLEKLGFKGGRMLEPSAGVGNFIGAMPESMSAKVRSWSGIELDRITGLVAKYLYPNADIRIEGFEKANLPDNYMDVAIGNVPFGNYGVVDRAYPKRITKAIHNYFFAKALDKVRPGGIVMFITSSFTMNSEDNSVRQYIMKRADLLGAIRLPNTAFAGNAGTQVVTDILILKKREAGTEYAGEAFLEAPYTVIEGNQNGANINEYFKNHPEMALGTPAFTRGMYGANSLTYNPLTDKGSLGEQIRKAFDKISGKMDYKEQQTPEKANFAAERAAKKPKGGSLEVGSDGKVYRNENGSKVEVSADKDTAERVSGLLGIRDAYRELINAQQQGLDSKTTEKARKELNRVYDAFVKKYGYINDAKNAKAFENDPDSFSLLSLENYKKPVKANKAKGIKAQSASAVKADIFTKNTITPNRTITHVESIPEGVIVSVNRTGGIDAAYIAQLTGKSTGAVTRELIDSRMAFKTKDGGLEAPETYLSGNVRAKLREAEALAALDKDFTNNVEELKRVVPADVPFEDIYVAVGTPWIPNSVYADFIADTLGGSNIESYYRKPDVTVGRTNTGEFKISINNKRLKTSFRNTQEFGTSRRTFLDLVEAMMMSRSITVKDVIEDTDGRKTSVVNTVETAAAQAKAEEIAKRFQEWLWQDETRRSALTSLYNETFNALATPKYNGENLTVNGLNAEFSLRRHQADAVQRIVASGGNTLLAHKVGAGKTLEMAAAAMKLRELGIVKKPVFVVPKALTAQWGGEFKSYFPAARLLVADETSFTPANRKTFANRISNGDFDAVILSYEQFEKIPMSAEFQQRFYQQQIDEVIDAIAEEKAESGGKALTVKEMEKKKAQLEKKLAELTSKPKDTDNIEFEQLGIDSLFVDEAHNFKNLQYITRMNNVSGLGNSSGSQRAFDLFTKIRYLQGLNGGRGVVFATATPVMNSMAEMYIMQKYLQSDMLDRLGLKTFDAWAKQFGEVVNSVEIKPSGQGFRVKQSFSNFRNLNELQLLFRSFSDVLTDVPGLKIPKMKGGKVQVVECEPGQFQQEYMKELEKRADNVKNVDPKEDNMLKITSDGRKVSYTQRMIDPSLPYEPGSKIFRCCENVVKEYRESSAIKGTQIVFCDMATPKGSAKTAASANANAEETLDTESARLYDDMKAELVKQGIPANEIAFIHEADTDAKKKQLFDDVNEGRVRVLIGSTGKMGVGMNAQKRIVAIHHLDAPWRPGDVEQRDGRAFRQGNINDEVTKYVYVTTGSFDARLWDILDRKQHFIEQIMNGENIGRSAEDTGNVTLSAAEVKALASGNPLIEEQVRLDSELAKLRNERKAYNAALMRAKTKLLEDEQKIASLKSSIAKAKKDVKARVDTYSENRYSMTVGKKTYTDKKEAGAALALEIVAKAKTGEFVTVGKFAGFEIRVIKQGSEYVGHITGAQSYKFNVYLEKTTYMATHIASVVEGIDGRIEAWNEALKETQADLEAQQKMIAEPFAKQAELDRKTARFNEIMDILNPKEEQIIGDEEDTVQYQARENEPVEERAIMSEARIDDLIADSGAGNRNDYARKWITSINPTDFLNMTLGKANQDRAKFDIIPGDYGSTVADYDFIDGGLKSSRQTPFLAVDVNTGEVVGHEGRHRMRALEKKGVTYAEIAIEFRDSDGAVVKEKNGNGNPLDTIASVTIFNQRGTGQSAVINNIIPLNKANRENIIKHYGAAADTDVQYQERSSPLTDREVLEMAAEGIEVDSLSEAEKNALDIFSKRLSELAQLQEERAELGRQYKQQQFTKGGSRQEAERILNAIQVLDSKIDTAENAAIGLENKDVLKGVLKKARRVVETQEKERGDAMLRRYRERRRESAEALKYRTRIKTEVETLRKWLVSPSSKDIRKHVPAEIQKTVADFLESINLMSKTALRTSGLETTKADNKYLKSMKKMRDAIKANVNAQGLYSGYADLPEGFFEAFDTLISQTEELMSANSGGFVVNLMSAAELKELSKTLRTLKKYITTMNVLHNNAVFRHAGEAAENTIEYLGRLGKSDKSGTAYKFIRFDYMRPSYAFEHFGKGGQSIEREFREGQAVQAKLADKVIDFAKRTYTGEEVRKWSEEIKSFTLSDGEKVSMPVTHLMSLYCLNKRAQALTHIYGDGIRVANFKSGQKTVLDEGHIVSFEDVKKMLKELTPRQREVAEALQRYMSTEAAQWGNYVSMARFDVEQFTEENYFPINSDGRYLSATADESPNNAGLYALLNSSFTKELKENASNRLILYNIFDVFANHTASVAQYRAFALPVLDALKWFNYKNDSTSVRTKLSSAFGAPLDERAGSGAKGYAEQFVINLLKAYNGTSPQGDPYDSLPLKMLHRFNGAAIAYNTRVVIQQPTAIARAAMILSPAKLSKGLGMSIVQMRKLAEEMEQYSGIAAWKALGFYDTNISRGLTELIKQNPSTLDRVMDIGTKGAEWADRFTWAAMWYAAKSTVNRSAYDTEEAYFKAVTELFEEVIYKTQVVDSILTKSEFLRAKGGLARQLGSFMSEPSATISMLADAAFKFTDDIQRGMDRSEAWKRNGANIAKTAAVFAVGQVILAAVQAVIDAWRDDDDYSEEWLENFFAKYLKAFKGNAVEELLPFGKIPVVSELYEVMKGWLDYAGIFEKIGLDLYGSDISSGLSMYLKYIDKAARIIIDKLVGNKTNYTDYGIIFNLIKGASNLTGIPMATAWREVQDIWNNTVGFISPRMKLTTYRSSFDRTYLEYIEPSGLSKSAYQAILERADGVFGNGNGSYAQDEVGAALMSALEDGNINEAQADAIWHSKWHGENSRSFSEWRSKNSGKSSSAPAGNAETSESGSDYDSFKENVPLYKTAAKEAAYSVWETQLKPAGISLDRFTELLNSADSDGNGSLKQDEMGFALMNAMQSGELSFDQCDAIWRVQWNGAKSKTFAKWLYG